MGGFFQQATSGNGQVCYSFTNSPSFHFFPCHVMFQASQYEQQMYEQQQREAQIYEQQQQQQMQMQM